MVPGVFNQRDRVARTLSINQRAYIEGMVEKFQLTQARLVLMPMEPGVQFSVDQCPTSLNQRSKMLGVPYGQAIGSVLWPVVISRPDAAYAVGVLSQFIQNPGQAHWEGVKRVISYLGSMKDLWLTFGGQKEILIEGFCDADWASQKHRHSISGFSFHYGVDAPLRLCASKQKQQQTWVFGGSSNRSTESNTEWWQPTR